jgi:hypothetical protein
MTRFVFALGSLAVLTITVIVAQDPPPTTARPAQPPAKATRPDSSPRGNPSIGQDYGAMGARAAARIEALREEFELLEAQRDVRRAHIRAAEIGVKSALISAERIEAIAKNGVVSKEEVEKAKLEVEAAKAQLAIRMAELKEIEIKLKYAKNRLGDAKPRDARPTRPATPADPPPARSGRGRDRGNE